MRLLQAQLRILKISLSPNALLSLMRTPPNHALSLRRLQSRRIPQPLAPYRCDGTGFSTTFLPSVVPYSRPYMWLRVLLTSRSLLAYLATLCMQSFTPLQAHPPLLSRCKLNYLSASPSSFGLHPHTITEHNSIVSCEYSNSDSCNF